MVDKMPEGSRVHGKEGRAGHEYKNEDEASIDKSNESTSVLMLYDLLLHAWPLVAWLYFGVKALSLCGIWGGVVHWYCNNNRFEFSGYYAGYFWVLFYLKGFWK